MARLPTVAIIGRPNTGKSTLFNRLVGHRKAIVSDVPGTTRDQVAGRVETDQLDFLLIDTGGMGGGSKDHEFEDDVQVQSTIALENSDLILFTINSREDLTSSDFEIIEDLRKKRQSHVPVIIVLTKCDDTSTIDEILPEYYALDIADEIVPISAMHAMGVEELKNIVIDKLTELNFSNQENEQPTTYNLQPKIAIIGKPNVGKSSLINAFMSEKQQTTSQLLVSEVPGTTRDAVDTSIKYHDQEYIFVDTAGIKRRKSTDKGIETYAYLRSIQSLEHSDIAVLVIDATDPVSKQDKRIARLAIEEGKGLIVLLNKSDKLSGSEKELAMQNARSELSFCKFAPFLCVSAETRKDLLKIFDLIEMVNQSRTRRIATKALNDWFRKEASSKSLSSSKLITQAEDVPPTFVLFSKNPKKIRLNQLKSLEKSLRSTFGFDGSPIRWITKNS
ncbi:MAG: ribosome biogenesis GTPase Der [Candidatus Peribacteraceae bacterium]|nr:ribosome biogenesis GTPase Der [Candidatus Peribacteraceae bacterium]MDP7454537.1 ribosome biogenesis GTPase Der [Candidatus Peribacteraceae bacterium]MDP7645876.1 ribosome biogenesis GTPase Der [Candidatus Peribacteraceae bacterium]